MATNSTNNSGPVVKIGERKKLQGTHHKYIACNSGKFTCNYCEKISKNRSTISEHTSRLHASEAGRMVMPFECAICKKRFNSVSIRDQHIQNNHFNIRDSCVSPGCKYKGKSGSALCSHYARKHMDTDSLITMIDGNIAECNHCNKQLNKSSIIYHLARCHPASPYCKSIQDSMRAIANLGLEEEVEIFRFEPLLDLSNAKPADKICSPFGSEKGEKMALVQAEPVFKKARKERTVRKPRRRILVIFEEIDSSSSEEEIYSSSSEEEMSSEESETEEKTKETPAQRKVRIAEALKRMREKMATPRVSTKKADAILKKNALCKEVVCELHSLQEMNASFGIRNKNEFIEVRDISIDASGKLCYSNSSNELKSLSSLIIEVKGLHTARWLNHLYFKNGCKKEHSFKKFVSQKYNLKFT